MGGGFTAEGNLSYTISCYDSLNNSWNFSVDIPYCLFSMAALNNSLLVAGGKDLLKQKTNRVFIMASGQLKNYTKMITARSCATAVGHQGMLIITGGKDDKDKRLSSTELFDSKNGQWYTCSDLPQPYSWLQSVIVDNILYLLRGSSEHGGSPAVFIASLDTLPKHQLKWNTHQDTVWHFPAVVSVNGTHLLTLGGGSLKRMGDKYPCTSDIYKLNKVNNSWEAIGHIPSARTSPAAVSTADNRIIVIGGRNDKGKETNTVWIGSCEPQQ